MSDEPRQARRNDYRAARIGASAALVVVVCIIVLIDALDPVYEASPVVLAALLGTIVTLLGIEARSIVGAK